LSKAWKSVCVQDNLQLAKKDGSKNKKKHDIIAKFGHTTSSEMAVTICTHS